MNNLKIWVLSSLIAIFLFQTKCVTGQSTPKLIGQDNYGSICNLGRQIEIIKNKYVVEFIVPIGWQRDNSQLKETGVTKYFPEVDSINRKTNIYLSLLPESFASIDLDVFINSEKAKNPDSENTNWEIQNNIFHTSVPEGKLFLIKDPNNNFKEYRAYLLSNGYTMTLIFKSIDLQNYEDYVKSFKTFLSSIRCSLITR